MKKYQINRTELVDRQIDEQLLWYIENVEDINIANQFIDAVEKAIMEIAYNPELASKFFSSRPKFSVLDDLDLRRKPLGDKFPFSIYYDFDGNIVNIRFIYKSGRNIDRLISDV